MLLKTGLLQNSIKPAIPLQFHSTSASESESETKINLIKIGKYIMYNKQTLRELL